MIIAVLPFGLLIIGLFPPPTCSTLSYTFPRVPPLPQQLQATIATQISRINFANHHGRHRSTKCDGCMPSHDVYFPTIWHAAVRSNGTSPGNWGMGPITNSLDCTQVRLHPPSHVLLVGKQQRCGPWYAMPSSSLQYKLDQRCLVHLLMAQNEGEIGFGHLGEDAAVASHAILRHSSCSGSGSIFGTETIVH